MELACSYRAALGVDEMRQAVHSAVHALSWGPEHEHGLLQEGDWRIDSDDGQELRLVTAGDVWRTGGLAGKETGITLKLVGEEDATKLELVAKVWGFGPLLRDDLGRRVNELTEAIVEAAGVPLKPA